MLREPERNPADRMRGAAFLVIFSTSFKQATKSKWLIMFTIVFFILAVHPPLLQLQYIGLLPPNYIAFYMGTLISNYFILMPLLALPLGSVSVVEDRESGALGYVLSTRIGRAYFLTARFAGLLAATSVIIALGFGIAALFTFQLTAGSIQLVYVTIAALFLNASMLGLSFLVSTLSRKRLTAHSMAILLWFIFTYASITLNLSNASPFLPGKAYAPLLPWIYLNPVVMARLVALMQMSSGLQDIGSAGLAVQYFYGANTINVLYEWMAVWVIVTMAAAYVIFRFQDIR